MGPLDEVLLLAGQDWRLFPCGPHTKTPLLKGWPALASSDPATIRKWAVKHPGCNWGVATGPGSGVFVLDVDGEKGRASLATLEVQHGPLTATLASHTGRADGGEHRWFNWPVDRNLRNCTGKPGDGLDIRAAGGYVIVPPSMHPTGRAYQWGASNLPIADAPPWLLEMVTTPVRGVPAPAAEIGILRNGQRNDGLTRLGGALRRRGASQQELEAELLQANTRRCPTPLPDAEVLKIAASVGQYPVGGPDPLETAWYATQEENYPSRYERFLALARQLQLARPNQNIALPLERIAELMGVHWSTVGLYRRAAVRKGQLEPVGEYIPHRRAALYRISEKTETLTKTLTSGLVRTPSNSPSENPLVRVNSISRGEDERKSADISRNVEAGNGKAVPRCYVHGEKTEWWKRIDGDMVCGRCHPNPAVGNACR